MSFNTIGKTLVFFNLIVSLLAMTWGTGIFLQQLDWGWKEPRKELGVRIPSEYDKRAVVLNLVYDGYLKVKPALQPARDNYDSARVMLAPNHLLYVQKLSELDSGPDPIKVLRLDYIKGILKLTGNKKTDPDRLNPPEFGLALNGAEGGPRENDPIAKSIKGYLEELEGLRVKSKGAFAKIEELAKNDQSLTIRLVGEVIIDPKTKEILDEIPGLYELQEIEKRLQAQYKVEMEYIRPIRELAVNDAMRFLVQKADLEEKLKELKNRKKKK
jgi:hypothetical protein